MRDAQGMKRHTRAKYRRYERMTLLPGSSGGFAKRSWGDVVGLARYLDEFRDELSSPQQAAGRRLGC
jgi:hypothetical protein